MFAGSAKKFIFTLNFFCASLLKIMHFDPPPPPPAYKIEHKKTKLTEMHTCSPILAVCSCYYLSFCKISNLEAIFDSRHFFYTPCISNNILKHSLFFSFPSTCEDSHIYIQINCGNPKYGKISTKLSLY